MLSVGRCFPSATRILGASNSYVPIGLDERHQSLRGARTMRNLTRSQTQGLVGDVQNGQDISARIWRAPRARTRKRRALRKHPPFLLGPAETLRRSPCRSHIRHMRPASNHNCLCSTQDKWSQNPTLEQQPGHIMCKKSLAERFINCMSEYDKLQLENAVEAGVTKALTRVGPAVVREGVSDAISENSAGWVRFLVVSGVIGLTVYAGVKFTQFGTLAEFFCLPASYASSASAASE